MDSKKVKIILAIAVSVFLLSVVALLLAAGIYYGAAELAASKNVMSAVGTPVLLGMIDPLILWIIAWAAGLVLIIVIILIIIMHWRKKKRKQREAAAVSGDGLDDPDKDIVASDDALVDLVADGMMSDFLAETENALSSDKSAGASAVTGSGAKTSSADAVGEKVDELLAKYIREVNETADSYRDCNAKIAALTKKRSDFKAKAALLQKRLFKAHSLELINRCSLTINKLYKLIAKYDSHIAENKKKRQQIHDELTRLRRTTSSYISIYKTPLVTVTAIEDEILFDIALSKRLVEESEYFPKTLESSVSSDIKEKKSDITDLEAETVYWQQSMENGADDDAKLGAMIKLLEIEEKLDAARDELGDLMCKVTDETPHKSVEEITAEVKKEIVSGSGVVTRDQVKIAARKNEW